MQCGAKTRGDTPCKKYAVRYGTRCRLHGGASPQAIAKARERRASEEATKLAQRHGIVPITDPLTELLALASEVKAVKGVLSERSATSTSDAAAFERTLDRLHRILSDVARLRIEERLAAISESQVERMIASLFGVVAFVVEGLGFMTTDPTVRALTVEAIQRAQRDLSAAPDLRKRVING